LEYPSQRILKELRSLSNETLDKDIIENSLEKIVEWLNHKRQNDIPLEPTFITDFKTDFTEFLNSVDDQVQELDYNAIWKLRVCLRDLNSFDFAKNIYEQVDSHLHFAKKIEDRYTSLLKLYAENSKKIKKQKNFEKKKKLFEADKKERLSAVEEMNKLLNEDDRQSCMTESYYKKEEKIKEEEIDYTKKEECYTNYK